MKSKTKLARRCYQNSYPCATMPENSKRISSASPEFRKGNISSYSWSHTIAIGITANAAAARPTQSYAWRGRLEIHARDGRVRACEQRSVYSRVIGATSEMHILPGLRHVWKIVRIAPQTQVDRSTEGCLHVGRHDLPQRTDLVALNLLSLTDQAHGICLEKDNLFSSLIRSEQ